MLRASSLLFFFNDTATTEIYTLSLHDALPISQAAEVSLVSCMGLALCRLLPMTDTSLPMPAYFTLPLTRDRKSTRLNSSHGYISYAVFCLKKKKKNSCNHVSIHDVLNLCITCT